MSIKKIELSWVVVKDFKKALQFYTDVVGLKVLQIHDEFGWAELSGHEGGATLGIAEFKEEQNDGVLPGDNAVVTLTVESIETATQDMCAKGLKLLGSMIEIPHHVKMQMFIDLDNNKLQLVEQLG